MKHKKRAGEETFDNAWDYVLHLSLAMLAQEHPETFGDAAMKPVFANLPKWKRQHFLIMMATLADFADRMMLAEFASLSAPLPGQSAEDVDAAAEVYATLVGHLVGLQDEINQSDKELQMRATRFAKKFPELSADDCEQMALEQHAVELERLRHRGLEIEHQHPEIYSHDAEEDDN